MGSDTRSFVALTLLSSFVSCAAPEVAARPVTRGTRLEELTWLEAEKLLTPETVVVIPIGAAAKEHGPHLKLNNDLLLAEHFAERVLEGADVVIAPTINYHFYPAFVEYPGSTTLRVETARDLVVDIVRSLARHGPRRFYALNTGISTVRALAPAMETLAADGILFRYTDLGAALGPIEEELCTQERGSHADESETSMMLWIAPETVDMSKAAKDDSERGEGGLTRDPNGEGTYSPTGIWGDATLATREKGQKICAALVKALLADIETVRRAPLPASASR
ncbi:MAG: creatininase family protein [Planctomycetota bacterium]